MNQIITKESNIGKFIKDKDWRLLTLGVIGILSVGGLWYYHSTKDKSINNLFISLVINNIQLSLEEILKINKKSLNKSVI